MKNLKRLGISVTLLCVLAMTAFADDPCAPGSTNSPPCVSAPATTDSSVVPGSTNSPPASSKEANYLITEVVDLVVNALLLF
jgi:hypothetical protein